MYIQRVESTEKEATFAIDRKRIGGTLAVKLMISVVEDHSRIAANPPKVAERSFIYIAREEKSMRGSTHI